MDSTAELQARLAQHERVRALVDTVDERLEHALRDRQPLERVAPDLLAILAQHLGASAALLVSFDESLAERVFLRGEVAAAHEIVARGRRDRLFEAEGGFAAGHELDVAGESFGTVIAILPREPSANDLELLAQFCEQLDNHLGAIAQARRRYEVIRSISDALKDPVLDSGIDRAIEILGREVGFDDLVLLFRHEDAVEGAALRCKVYRGGSLFHDSSAPTDHELDAFLRAHAGAFLDGDDEHIRERLGIRRYREEVLITGVRAARVVGRMMITSSHGEFHTHDRELLDRFADYLRQRIVDFNREWKLLSRFFSPVVCERLLREEGYVDRWLAPREHYAAVMFADISGFTRISETILRTPEAVGRLIAIWSEAAVEILWDTGGVFDKMVGDCAIGHWGPPFFETSAEQNCRNALEAAKRLRAHTRSLATHPGLPELAGLPPPDVAIGLNYCPLSVGMFGPVGDYTGFSSGMNNTARLQGLAHGGEILCMDSFVREYGDPNAFGPARSAEVKNVREPIVFHPLLEP